jgi:multidrug efflux pump subunit AcrA (membrane-fusion protein)
MQIGPGDAMLMQVGQKAYVKTDYIKDKSFEAQVARIDKVGKSVEGKGLVYRAWLEVNDNDNQLLLGIPVEIYITTEEKQAVLVVPSQAVHENFVTLVKQMAK